MNGVPHEGSPVEDSDVTREAPGSSAPGGPAALTGTPGHWAAGGATTQPGAGTAPEPVAGVMPEPGTARAQPGTGGGPQPAHARRQRRLRVLLVCVLLIAGIAGIAVGGGGLDYELTRQPTRAELAAASQADIASRWQRLPAGAIFPARVPYVTSDGARTTATRVGIAPPASCSAALDPAVAALLGRGCRTVLRATYADQSGTLVATMGVVVMSDAAVTARIEAGPGPAAGWSGTGVRAVAFPGTIAAAFTDPARQLFAQQSAGPYLVLVAAGFADGRVVPHGDATGPLMDLAANLPGFAVTALTSTARPPCARKDISC